METETKIDPLEAAEWCLTMAEKEEDQARMARFSEIAHGWMEIHRLRSVNGR